MLKSSKSILCLLMSIILSLSLFICGCGKEENSSVPTTAPLTEEPTEPLTTASPSTEDTAEHTPIWDYSKLKKDADKLSDTFDDLITKNKFRGTVYIKIGNDFEYIGTNGFSDKDNHKSNSLATCYRVGSITKQFTAVAIMQLKEQGKLTVDDTIDKYYPSYKYGKKISIKNLLTMTAGLKDYSDDSVYFDVTSKGLSQIISKDNSAKENKKAILEWIFSNELESEPGENYKYSNTSYYLLGDIIEKVSGMSYEKYITENLLKPCAMKSSGFEANDKLAKGYQEVSDSEWNIFPGVAYSAGGLISNVPDLLKWVDALCNNTLISKESFDEMTTAYTENYGYGFMLDSYYVGHAGKIDKYNSLLTFTKNQTQVSILLSNYSQSEPINIFRRIFDKFKPYKN